MSEALKSYLNYLDTDKLTPYVLETMRQIESALAVNCNRSSFITLFIHICCMIERSIFDKSSKISQSNNKTYATPLHAFKLKQAFHELEDAYRVRITDDEFEFLYEYINNNT